MIAVSKFKIPALWAVIALLASFMVALAAYASADFPQAKITIVVPHPGGSVDTLMRLVGPRLSDALGYPVIIENRPGAGGSIGVADVARAKPDGYTLLAATNAPFTITPLLTPNIGYDTLQDFEPISIVGESSLVLLVNPQLGVHSVGELIALAKRKPKVLNSGISGFGTPSHLALTQFDKMAGCEITPVPYRGGPPILVATMTGEVQMTFLDEIPAIPFIRDHRVNVLASTGRTALLFLPDVPTVSESGVSGFDVRVWNGMVGPRGIPKLIVQKLNHEIEKIFEDPDFRQQIAALGIEPRTSTAEEFAEFMRSEVMRWHEIVSEAGLKAE